MKKIKKIYWILAIAGWLCLRMDLSGAVLAEVVTGSAADNTIAASNRMNLGDTVNGVITETDDLDYYAFQLESAGCVILNMTSYMQYYCIKIFDADGERVWYTDVNEWTETVGYRRDSHDIYLEKGTYYMQISGYKYKDSTYDWSTGRYECSTSFASSGVNNIESDNSFSDANDVTLGDTVIGQISMNDDFDTFKFLLSEAGCVTLDMTSYMRYYCIKIFGADGKRIWYTDVNEWTETVGYCRDSYQVYLEKGTYYMQVDGYKYKDSTYDWSTGKYVVETEFAPSAVSFGDDNNSFEAADSVVLDNVYTGQISVNDDFDTYRFELPSDRSVVVHMTSYMRYYCIKIFDSDGERIWYTDVNEWNSNVGYREDTYNITLSAGVYYMQIDGYKYKDSTYDWSTGKYVFSLAELNQSNCEHMYIVTTVEPTYFKKGYDLHKCEKCKKSYKDNYTAKMKLEQGYLSISSSAGNGKLYLEWPVLQDASGYEIRYSKSKDMHTGVGSKIVKGQTKYKTTISKLSRRQDYYVQVRAYKKLGGQVVYGKWSAKKCLRTK